MHFVVIDTRPPIYISNWLLQEWGKLVLFVCYLKSQPSYQFNELRTFCWNYSSFLRLIYLHVKSFHFQYLYTDTVAYFLLNHPCIPETNL